VRLKQFMFVVGLVFFTFVGPVQADAQTIPPAIAAQLPPNTHVMASASALPSPGLDTFFVVVAANNETRNNPQPRPALVFQKRPGSPFRLVARNDFVVMRADEGFQCDPFEDGRIATLGSYVTFENSVACGQHWTYFVTFKYNANSQSYAFDNERSESWRFNPDNRPDAEALISDGVRVTRARGKAIRFNAWRRRF
jgi:hypothetical protein